MTTNVITEDEDLRISHLPGASDRMIVSFTGIQFGMGGVPVEEFLGSARGDAGHHVVFVSDLRRSWFSRAGLVRRIVDTVRTLMVRNGIKDVSTLGSSMGGYGAILFSSVLGARSVAAFAPQISMHSDVIAEKRWSEFRASFGPDLRPSLAGIVSASKAPVFVTFGRRDQEDRQRARLLQPAPNLHLRMVAGAGHVVSKSLKDAGLLRGVVEAKIGGDVGRVSALLDQFEQTVSPEAVQISHAPSGAI